MDNDDWILLLLIIVGFALFVSAIIGIDAQKPPAATFVPSPTPKPISCFMVGVDDFWIGVATSDGCFSPSDKR